LIDTSNVTDFRQTWRSCGNISPFPAIDLMNGQNFFETWLSCNGITSFAPTGVSSGRYFEKTWQGCSNLVSFPANFFDSWAGVPLNNCFVNAWNDCTSLSATSVENILNSIDTSGISAPASGVDITIDYDAGSGSPNIATAVTNLKGRGWTITLNGVAQ